MLGFVLSFLVGISSVSAQTANACFEADEVPATPAACCRICTTGKACGNSCINRQLECHQPTGCACDG